MPKKRNTKLPAIKQLPSGAYHASVYSHTDADGKRHYESFTSFDYNAVLLEVAQFKADKRRDKTENAAKVPTLGEAMTEFVSIKTDVLSPTTYRLYKGFAKNHFESLRNVPIDQITHAQIQVEINKISASHSPKTVRNVHGFLSSVFSIYRPGFSFSTTLPQKKKNEIVVPTEEDIKLLFDLCAGTDLEIPVLLAACCGLRRSEICAIKWSNVDFRRNTITINHAVVLDENNNFVEKSTKTAAGTRTIRMFPLVSDSLKRCKDSNPDTGDYIAPRPNTISNRFRRLIKKQGLPHYRFHDLRHYTVSVMLSLNIPKKYIADYVGHESENMIDQVYGHIMTSKKTSVEDQMQDYFVRFLAK